MAVDVGTEGVRAGIFDLKGNAVAISRVKCAIRFLKEGWIEQDPYKLWKTLKKSILCCLNTSHINSSYIGGISIDSATVTLIAVDNKGNPLRPAILWMDTRAYKEAEMINHTNHPILKFVGGNISPEWMIPKMLWLKNNELDLYKRAYKIVGVMDWLVYKLTGQWTASLCNVSCEWNYVSFLGGWQKDFLETVGLEDVFAKLPDKIYQMGSVISELKPKVAEEIGLSPHTLVIESGIDGYAAALGVNVFKAGRVSYILGSSSGYVALSSTPRFSSGIWGPVPDAIVPGQWVIEGGQTSAGSIIRWFRENFFYKNTEESLEKEHNLYSQLDKEAEKISPGSEGLIVLDYWQGNRIPFGDSLAKGVVVGLSLNHTYLHIYRAILEGIAYGGYHIVKIFNNIGVKVNEIWASGGGSKSRLWMQIHADIFNIPIILPKQPEASLLGDAICVATGEEIYASLQEAANNMVQIGNVIEPRFVNHKIYKEYFQRYLRIYPTLRGLIHELARGTSEI